VKMKWFEAAERGNVAELRRHLDAGQKVDARDGRGPTALLLAVENGHAEAVKLLLDHGAKPAHADAPFCNPFHKCEVDPARADLLKLLLEHGLNPNGGRRGMGSYLEKAVTFAADESKEGRTGGEQDVLKRKDAAWLKTLIDAGADVAKVQRERSPSLLAPAIGNGDHALARFLVKRGCDVNHPWDTAKAETPLMWAAEYGKEAEIKLLVELGADLEAKDRRGRTALAHALRSPNHHAPRAVELLRKLGAAEPEKKFKPFKPPPVKPIEPDPITLGPFAQRRGTLDVRPDYASWTAVSLFAGGKDGIDGVADALEKAATVRRDVTKAALSGKLAAPRGPYWLIVKLKGHDWAVVDLNDIDEWDEAAYQWLSRHAKTRLIRCGYQDTASTTFFYLYDNGKRTIDFETTGLLDTDTRFKSSSHAKGWWRQFEDENEALQALVREQDAYVPKIFTFFGDEYGTVPQDTLKPANVERIILVANGPARPARSTSKSKSKRK